MSASLPHRPALDGVRAVAVILVVLYHGGVRWVPGGFLGVDVFFVVSGFLITSLLLVEWADSGRVDLSAFWFRRARRLFPALVLVLLVTAVYAAVLAPDIVRDRLRGDMLAALLYVANWRFVVTGAEYFEQYAAPSPLLHTWSLAIEEQFYLIWPLALLLLLRPLARLATTTAFITVAAVCGVGALASAAAMVALYEPGLDPSRVYYGTDTRAQALLVGAATAGLCLSRGWWADQRQARWKLLSASGVVSLVGLLVLGALGSDNAPWMYRGGFLLTAVLSAVVIVCVTHREANPLTRLLSMAPLRWIGLASYGIYLWHWVVFVIMTPERTGISDLPLLIARLAVTAVLATASYVWVEQPIRRWQRPRGEGVWNRRAVGWLSSGVAVCLAATILGTGARATQAPSATPTHSPSSIPPTTQSPSPSTTPPGTGTPTPTLTSTPPQDGRLSVFLLGDSVAWNLHSDYLPDPALKLDVTGSTKLACGQFPGVQVVFGKRMPLHSGCLDWPQEWRDYVADVKPDVSVMMPGNLELFDHADVNGKDYTFGTPAYRNALLAWMEDTTKDLGRSSRRVAITTVPCYRKIDTGFDDQHVIVNATRRQDWLNSVIRDFVHTHPQVHLVDLRAAVCPNGGYSETIDGVTLRVDGVHWTPEGAAWVWRWMAEELRATD